MDQQKTERHLLRVAAILIGIAILIIAFANARVDSPWGRIILTAIAAIPFLFGAFLIYLVILSKRAAKRKHNYFLYDRALKGNMSPDQLTSAQVADRTLRYMALFRKGKQLYINALFDEKGGAPEVFKPLFCYQLLGMMSVCTERAQWDAFLDGGKELADIFATYLTQSDEDLNRHVQYYMAQADCDVEEFRAYLESKSEYLSQQILAYTKEHLHEFD